MLPRTYFVGLLLPLFLSGHASVARAHAGEDHSQDQKKATPAATAGAAPAIALDPSSPSRLADGSLFVPKASQRQLDIRTVAAEIREHAGTIELNGKVVADPGAGGKVPATQAGRLVAGPKGLALLGQRVRQGEVLGYLQPVANSLERGSQQAELAELTVQHEIAVKRLARLEQLEGVVPEREIESARLEAQGLAARKAALGTGLAGREPLVAPVSGVVASVNVALGQVVEARETLFEVVDPQRLAVEALAYDAETVAGLGEATAAIPQGVVQLTYLGGGRVLREGALPVLFRVRPGKDGSAAPLAVGQPLKVFVRSLFKRIGVVLPVESVTRNGGGESVVWVHATAERFQPRKVTVAPQDGARVVVTAGLAAGERVVVQGAASLAQVR